MKFDLNKIWKAEIIKGFKTSWSVDIKYQRGSRTGTNIVCQDLGQKREKLKVRKETPGSLRPERKRPDSNMDGG